MFLWFICLSFQAIIPVLGLGYSLNSVNSTKLKSVKYLYRFKRFENIFTGTCHWHFVYCSVMRLYYCLVFDKKIRDVIGTEMEEWRKKTFGEIDSEKKTNSCRTSYPTPLEFRFVFGDRRVWVLTLTQIPVAEHRQDHIRPTANDRSIDHEMHGEKYCYYTTTIE